MARLRLFKGFTFNQINEQIFYPVAVNPELNLSKNRFEFNKAESIVPIGGIGTFKLIFKGNFNQPLFSASLFEGKIKSVKLVGPGGKYFIIDNIKTKLELGEFYLKSLNVPLDSTALTDYIFKGGIKLDLKSGPDFFDGTPGRDVIDGKGGSDIILGAGGSDKLKGSGGSDTLVGESGSDYLDGGIGNDRLEGGAKRDKLFGGKGDDDLFGDGGKDLLNGGSGVDFISGGKGNDTVNAGGGNDIVFGGPGNDVLRGEDGRDLIFGDDGGDIIFGGEGKDRIFGNAGADKIRGGPGEDTFLFASINDSGTESGKRDVILDFSKKQGDIFDVSQIDAKSDPGDQEFIFIGGEKFSGVEGELRVKKGAKKTLVMVDIDGDASADFIVELTGSINLTEDFFNL